MGHINLQLACQQLLLELEQIDLLLFILHHKCHL